MTQKSTAAIWDGMSFVSMVCCYQTIGLPLGYSSNGFLLPFLHISLIAAIE